MDPGYMSTVLDSVSPREVMSHQIFLNIFVLNWQDYVFFMTKKFVRKSTLHPKVSINHML